MKKSASATTMTMRTRSSTFPPRGEASTLTERKSLLERTLALHPLGQTRVRRRVRTERAPERRPDRGDARHELDTLECGDRRAARRPFAGPAHHERTVERVGEELHQPGKPQERTAGRDDRPDPGKGRVDDTPESRGAKGDALEHRASDVLRGRRQPNTGKCGSRGIVPAGTAVAREQRQRDEPQGRPRPPKRGRINLRERAGEPRDHVAAVRERSTGNDPATVEPVGPAALDDRRVVGRVKDANRAGCAKEERRAIAGDR